jgi:predicted RNase H-like nuclease (RuvC/YqgF family)
LRRLKSGRTSWTRRCYGCGLATADELRNADPGGESSFAEIAAELQRVETLRPKLEEARSLMEDLETRARELRTAWLLRQSG